MLRLVPTPRVFRRNLKTSITGLGNPEPQYKGSRHNIGLYILDQIKSTLVGNVPYKESLTGSVHYLSINPELFLIRSDGDFINLSGNTIVPLWRTLPKDTRHVVIHDDLNLPMGKIQLRGPGTSLRGHNGLKSIDKKLGCKNDFYKLSIGIDRPESHEPNVVAKYVLDKIDPSQLKNINKQAMSNVLEVLRKEKLI
ncbi:aminoacyl-tRNA hydrolase NDAI_0K00310 [Naumovozyma dairenensis CBS 421]|uniref:peptidyl-tRNA hydrolase n=1 Tax=Naumovozyma dairenensis (strain ATCC 10597 / BCRC 20456 / CBS 421 / NBRC 0211 / NRRL Y-12639) TaxID=1071378 RepID=G0WHF9_NAUDC|nr:hypothetical protein NDAI_0K00310 [Naumovozyma dairenensis CBS 421]CCD27220.1 hypothetical protein NDAI_0K00310 [Naumovozyma dairenensis CBS 421]